MRAVHFRDVHGGRDGAPDPTIQGRSALAFLRAQGGRSLPSRPRVPQAPRGRRTRAGIGHPMSRTALVAIGGNALVLDGEPGSIPRQQERAATFADQVADLIADDWRVLVTHGNGPQVGFILRRGELVAAEAE